MSFHSFSPFVNLFSFNHFSNFALDIPNHPDEQFHGRWPILNGWQQSKRPCLTGGLASPPDSRFNSPVYPLGSSSALQRRNISPSRCVDPKDLQCGGEPSSTASDDSGCDEDVLMGDAHSEDADDGDGDANVLNLGNLSQSSGDGKVEGDSMVGIESEKPVSESKKGDDRSSDLGDAEERDKDGNPANVENSSQSSGDGKEEGDSMVGVESKEPSSKSKGLVEDGSSGLGDVEEGDEDANPANMENLSQSSADGKVAGDSTVVVESKKSLLESKGLVEDGSSDLGDAKDRDGDANPSNVENLLQYSGDGKVEGDSMVGVESKEPSSKSKGLVGDGSSDLGDLEEGDEEVEGDSMVGVESKEPSSKSKGLVGDGSSGDVEEGDEDVEGDSMVGVESKEPSSKSKGLVGDGCRKKNAITLSDSSTCPTVPILKPISQTVTQSNQILSDYECSVRLAAQIGPRRSTRNILAKNSPAVNYVDYMPPRKSISSKKKPAFEKESIVQLVGLPIFLSNMGYNFHLG
jgi:hypothetical protein